MENKTTVLVIDDEEPIRDSCRQVLTNDGYRVDVAEDGLIGLKKVKELKPDLVKVHFFTLYPGSIDYEEYRDKCGEIVSQHHYLNPITNLSNMDDSTLRKVQLKFYRKFLFRPSFAISHFLKYLLYYLMNLPDSWRLLKEGVVFLIFSGKPTDNQKSAGGSKTH